MNPIIKRLLLPFAVKLGHRMKQIDWGLENLHGIQLQRGINWLNDISNDINDFKGNIFVDIGANRGSFSKSLLTIDDSATIHAFEPDPTLCRHLKKSFQRDEEVQIHQLAVSDENGQAEFRL